MTTANSRRLLLPPLAERLTEGTPVFTREQVLDVLRRVMAMTSAPNVTVQLSHTVKNVTQLSANQVCNSDDGEILFVRIHTEFGDSKGSALLQTNQLDEPALRELVIRAELVSREMIGSAEQIRPRQWDEQDEYPAAMLWHTSSLDALHMARTTVVPQLVENIQRQRLLASGFIGVMARAEAVLTERGVVAYSRETDCEVSVTAHTTDGITTGWGGTSARDWSSIDPLATATAAAEIARRNRQAQAVEPGRRTAILSSAAVAQLMRFLALHFDGIASDFGNTGFSRTPGQHKGSRFHEQLFDRRVKITTDPTDPEGGFKPWFGKGYVNHPTTWVNDGQLKYLSYGVDAVSYGKPYAELPYGFRLEGGDTMLEQMVAQCDEGIYVIRCGGIEVVDWSTGMLTGVTRDGCFLVKHGKIDRPVKNFRFLVSPFFLLNNIIAWGPTRRAAFGYTPWTNQERGRANKEWQSEFFDWPRRPMIVPPMMVRDFNFCALGDTV